MSNARNLSDIVGGNFDIPAGSLDNAVPANGSITTAKLADDAVTSAKIADDAVVSAALATDAVGADALSSSAIASGDLPTGSVLQVVQTTNTTDTTITTATNFMTVNITPSSTSNKILLLGNLASVARRSNTGSEGLFTLYRGSTSINVVDGITPWNDGASNQRSVGSISFNYLDSPSTTSATSYHFQCQCSGQGVDINDEGGLSSIIAVEIAG
tara:strand:- start:377 stop:1018 length:642 start_codon:yes stop_codon:yes gene_type:complete